MDPKAQGVFIFPLVRDRDRCRDVSPKREPFDSSTPFSGVRGVYNVKPSKTGSTSHAQQGIEKESEAATYVDVVCRYVVCS